MGRVTWLKIEIKIENLSYIKCITLGIKNYLTEEFYQQLEILGVLNCVHKNFGLQNKL